MSQQASKSRRMAARAAGVTAIVLALAGMLAPAASASASPDLTITKTSDAAGALSVGDRFTYTLTVSNVGTATAHKVVVSDDFPTGVRPVDIVLQFPGATCTFASSQTPGSPPANSLYCRLDPMAAGSVVTIPFMVQIDGYVRCGSLKNTATVRASDEPTIDRGDDSASVTDQVVCEPSIALATSAPAYAHVGGSVPFTMSVHNDGQVDLGAVSLTGPGCAPVRVGDGNGDGTLAVDEVWTYRCARAVGAARDTLTGTARVDAWTDAEQKVSASDAATVRILDPGISITVTPDPISGTPGDTITYSYVVSNIGDAPLSDISVQDDHLGHIGDIAQLQPGHDATLRATRVLSATDVWVTNTATVRGTDPAGHSFSDEDVASVTIVSAGSDGHGGTAFTGLDATPAATIAVLLALLGWGLLVAARRRA